MTSNETRGPVPMPRWQEEWGGGKADSAQRSGEDGEEKRRKRRGEENCNIMRANTRASPCSFHDFGSDLRACQPRHRWWRRPRRRSRQVC